MCGVPRKRGYDRDACKEMRCMQRPACSMRRKGLQQAHGSREVHCRLQTGKSTEQDCRAWKRGERGFDRQHQQTVPTPQDMHNMPCTITTTLTTERSILHCQLAEFKCKNTSKFPFLKQQSLHQLRSTQRCRQVAREAMTTRRTVTGQWADGRGRGRTCRGRAMLRMS